MAPELTRQRKIAYSIVGFLVVALVGVLAYSQFIGARKDVVPRAAVARVGGLRSDEASQPFDVVVLQDPRYTSLNRALLDAGRLPVPVPQSRGKPNPFGL